MNNYSVILSPNISPRTKIKVWELCKNGKSLFEPFIEQIESNGNLFKQLAGAIRIVEDTSNQIRKPKAKFREIQGHNLNCKVYEAKSKSIRIYLFHEKHKGRIIVAGGLKDNQPKDIKLVLRTIKNYYEYK